MSKKILAGALAAATLGLASCGGAEENNMAIENVEDLNATEDLNMDMNADMNMDMNADVNATVNATDDAAANDADANTTNSY